MALYHIFLLPYCGRDPGSLVEIRPEDLDDKTSTPTARSRVWPTQGKFSARRAYRFGSVRMRLHLLFQVASVPKAV